MGFFVRPDMKQGLIALTLLLLSCGVLAQSCHFSSLDGCEYDFSSLVVADGSPYYEFNETDTLSAAFGFYELNNGTSFNCGMANNNFQDLTPPAGSCRGASLLYTNGTFCGGAGVYRQSTIKLICNASASPA